MTDSQFNQAYEKHSRTVFHCIMRIVGNEATADEILQETFIRFLEKADVDRVEEHKTFLIRISHNLAIDYLKKASRSRALEAPANTADKRNYQQESDAKLLRDSIIAHLEKKYPRYLPIFLLRVDYELTYGEIASTMKIPLRTVMRYVENLKKILVDFV